jgi:hypothetical protein
VEHRKTITRTEPPQPERTREVLVSEYTCDRCGTLMPDYNATGGFLPKLEGTTPRNTLTASLSREHFSGEPGGSQHIHRDYCDTCLPGIWEQITRILAYDAGLQHQ